MVNFVHPRALGPTGKSRELGTIILSARAADFSLSPRGGFAAISERTKLVLALQSQNPTGPDQARSRQDR